MPTRHGELGHGRDADDIVRRRRRVTGRRLRILSRFVRWRDARA